MTESIFAIFCFPMQFHKHNHHAGEPSIAEAITLKNTKHNILFIIMKTNKLPHHN